ncbi:MAG: hypothetical protein A2268_00560 [Candidatus Raymondbacteria bacterium RifOxyA12_full_50_37]|uniref:HTH araC/xylS-type domain-containing protein n=1 Tax=Candidatus Raymondbacteria bacterium RIFOXYD12_FULL_49_13 TaxID=1817890 RepID=A0A1F7F2X4_UNCRA|nr:MAG: hypothetical protein A2268_00560 [Candidatus Raymondbacteria bacterium RifOxyA12_full_50_37]OGJ92805.1 MAG: hypothetical protein A2248_04610 [Candidatus Raymondbacteria bacterium RIFOXYA2_FULL_49_16]OGK01005.1 MAG: hypothetical protein A2519_17275 [Candidatus Raymondbacteria bacterium RIFOXYD12_FULL_49_13]OGK03555.1 MAG: hypothetical protein A2487_06735 [Candidatus Raymondbacteria bacterium RifOxyC12_full_50_8]OGP44581.1 MAG: hypothetical protein A2324_10405 [Candidatus Raymondbacteria 
MAKYLINPAIPDIGCLRKFGLPEDYFKGTAPQPFTLPSNVLVWLRENEEPSGLDACHYRYLLCFNFLTQGNAVVDQCVYSFDPYQGMLIFPFQFHHFRSPSQKNRQWILITFEMNETPFFDQCKNRIFSADKNMLLLLRNLIDAYTDEKVAKASQNRVPLLLGLLLNEIALGFQKSSPRQRTNKTAFAPKLALTVHKYIYAHLGEGLGIKTIAREFGMSESRLRTKYREELGISLGKTLQTIRFGRAQELMTAPGKSISEIASACGYQSLYAFSLAFKKRYGVPPRQFRQRIVSAG